MRIGEIERHLLYPDWWCYEPEDDPYMAEEDVHPDPVPVTKPMPKGVPEYVDLYLGSTGRS